MQQILNETVVSDVIFPHSYVHVRPCLLTDRLSTTCSEGCSLHQLCSLIQTAALCSNVTYLH